MALSRLFRHYLGFSLAILITVLISAVPTKAEVPFYWDAIKVEIDVQQNSDMWITETQKYVFTGNYTNERYRYILVVRKTFMSLKLDCLIRRI